MSSINMTGNGFQKSDLVMILQNQSCSRLAVFEQNQSCSNLTVFEQMNLLE